MIKIPAGKDRPDATSHDTVRRAEQQLEKAAQALAGMADDYANAQQIKEYNSDRLKRALADVMSVLLGQDETATAAECHARASETYRNASIQLGVQYRDALRIIERYKAQHILWDTARSLLASERSKMNLL